MHKLKIITFALIMYISFIGFLFASDSIREVIGITTSDEALRGRIVTITTEAAPSLGFLERKRQYSSGFVSIGSVEDVSGWKTAVDRLKTHGWHVKASDSLSYSHNECRTNVDATRLKSIFEGLCSTVVSVGTATGGAGVITKVISDAVGCFASAVKGDETSSTLTFSRLSEQETAVKHFVIQDDQYEHVAGYFLSFERSGGTILSPLHERNTVNVRCDGQIVLFELHPPVSPTVLPLVIHRVAPVDRYDWLPDGCTTQVYVALIDYRFKNIASPPKGHAGWCQIVDTRDSEGDIVYSIRHFLRNASGTTYGLWSAQKAQAEIEILIGSKYRVLEESKKIGGEVKTPEIHSSRKSNTFKDELLFGERDINRHKHWMEMAMIGMPMPTALSCGRVIETIKSMLKYPTREPGSKPLEYCLYGCRWFSKAINCIPWPFMFWESALGRRVCNKNMGEHLDFKKWVSYCEIEDGFNGFFNESGDLIAPQMRLVQIPIGGRDKHRTWMKSGRDGMVNIVGENEVAYRKFDWKKKV